MKDNKNNKAPSAKGDIRDGAIRASRAKKITWAGFYVNLVLSAGKILAGFFGRSSAMIADGIHSLSDFLTDVVVLVFIGISNRKSDESHDYGHGKYEALATLIISIALIAVGVTIMVGGVEKIIKSVNGDVIAKPSIIALVAALVSIISKEILFRVTKKVGVEIQSDAVVANAWHHRSDAFSSIGTALGIGGAIFLSEKWRILDPIASIIVSVFIIIAGIKITIPPLKELLDHSLSPEVEKDITDALYSVEGVRYVHGLKTMKNGNSYIIDTNIHVAPELTVVQAHQIATKAEKRLKDRFPGNIVQTSIHIEPDLRGQDDD